MQCKKDRNLVPPSGTQAPNLGSICATLCKTTGKGTAKSWSQKWKDKESWSGFWLKNNITNCASHIPMLFLMTPAHVKRVFSVDHPHAPPLPLLSCIWSDKKDQRDANLPGSSTKPVRFPRMNHTTLQACSLFKNPFCPKVLPLRFKSAIYKPSNMLQGTDKKKHTTKERMKTNRMENIFLLAWGDVEKVLEGTKSQR